jgi:hypothetical protein
VLRRGDVGDAQSAPVAVGEGVTYLPALAIGYERAFVGAVRIAQFVSEGHVNSSFAVVDRPWPRAVELRRIATLTVRTRGAPALGTCGVGRRMTLPSCALIA